MRSINFIVVHASASDNPDQDSLASIKHLHTANKKTKIKWGKYYTTGNGWSDIGYHYVITKDGKCHTGRPIEKKGAHVKGFNATSIGICLTGDHEFTQEQFKTLREVISELLSNLGLSIIDVVGHRDLNKGKTCPNFDVNEVLRGIDDIPETNS